MYGGGKRERAHASKTPNEKEAGIRPRLRGCIRVREQVVRPVSSLYVTFGSWAAEKQCCVNMTK